MKWSISINQRPPFILAKQINAPRFFVTKKREKGGGGTGGGGGGAGGGGGGATEKIPAIDIEV